MEEKSPIMSLKTQGKGEDEAEPMATHGMGRIMKQGRQRKQETMALLSSHYPGLL